LELKLDSTVVVLLGLEVLFRLQEMEVVLQMFVYRHSVHYKELLSLVAAVGAVVALKDPALPVLEGTVELVEGPAERVGQMEMVAVWVEQEVQEEHRPQEESVAQAPQTVVLQQALEVQESLELEAMEAKALLDVAALRVLVEEEVVVVTTGVLEEVVVLEAAVVVGQEAAVAVVRLMSEHSQMAFC